MSKPVTFVLKNEALNMNFGRVVFNGKFIFELDDEISPKLWKEIGFIPLEKNKKSAESEELFFYLNSRLPINLRGKSAKKKIEYIKDQGLRVASDSFVLASI